MSSDTDVLNKTREKIDKVGRGFCLAKWLQVTIHLQTGHTHSCHHPATHKVPLAELKDNPSALHNTEFKKQQRKEMLEGGRPKECSYCWNIEDLPGSQFSDRHFKSNDEWAAPFFDDVIKAGATGNINPKYLEVSFSSTCNFKCAYCHPSVSSKWQNEIKEKGPYPTHSLYNSTYYLEKEDKMPIQDEDLNPYVKSFWEWWPSLYPDLKVFRVTGGEPLLAKSTFKMLDYVKQNPKPDLSLGINTNLGVPFEVMERFVSNLKEIQKNNSVKKVYVYTSLDTWGKQAEAIRDGLDIELFQKNLDYLMENVHDINLTFMCTFNLFSVPRFHELVAYINKLKERESNRGAENFIFLDISYLRHPQFLSVKVLDCEYASNQLQHSLQIMENNTAKAKGHLAGFHEFEVIRMKRLIEYIRQPYIESEQKWQRLDLHAFVSEYEKRREYNFTELYPELSDFLAQCKAAHDEWQSINPDKKWAGDFFKQEENQG